MNPKETEETMHLIFKIRDSGLAVVVIEHDMRFIFNLCDRVLCLVRGEVLIEGLPGEVQSDPGSSRRTSVATTTRGGGRVSAMLEVKDLVVSYGKIKAVKGISFTVGEGEVVSLIGTNGAGKTTTLRTISGLLRPTSGSITFNGQDLTKVAAHDIVQLGLAHSPEGRRIFPKLSVEENLMLGAFARRDKGIRGDLDAAFDLFPILRERRTQPAGTFSGGEQQMLAMGRAMMSRPKLLMLDEPSMGLSPIMMKRIMTTVSTLQQQGTTILLVEQNAQAALTSRDEGLRPRGRRRSCCPGPAQELLESDDVRKAYLGED